MSDTEPEQPAHDTDELAERVIAEMRKQGLGGNIAYDKEGKRLLNEATEPFYLVEVLAQYRLVAEAERAEWIERFVRVFLQRPRAPETWDEAKAGVLPRIRPRMAYVCWSLRNELEGLTIPRIPYGDVTEHLVVELAWPVEDAIVAVNHDDLERWGITAAEGLEQAGSNLSTRSQSNPPWLQNQELPGVMRSPWRDRADAARIGFKTDFGLGFNGPPVAVALSESCLLLADGDDEDALFNLGRAARRELERTRQMLWLRPLRLDPSEGRWKHWLPQGGSASHGALSLLWALNEKADYDQHGALLARYFTREKAGIEVAELEVIQDPTGRGATVTTWADGPRQALPMAEFIRFAQGDETLVVAPFRKVLAEFKDMLEEKPGYPPRWLTTGFPQSWQLHPFRKPADDE